MRCAPRLRYGIHMFVCDNAVYLPYCAGHNRVVILHQIPVPGVMLQWSGIVKNDPCILHARV